jgi:hypothetical protein
MLPERIEVSRGDFAGKWHFFRSFGQTVSLRFDTPKTGML